MTPLSALILGLTAGGLSCLAVQAGLLISSLADETEDELEESVIRSAKHRDFSHRSNERRRKVRIIGLFLLAKLAAYTTLGLLLGLFGKAVRLSPAANGWMQLLIALFMIVTALRLFDVHPIFRYFAIEPPKRLRKWLKQRGDRANGDAFEPLLLGALTVLIPCGITQTVLAAAIVLRNPFSSAVLVASFVIGTFPLFFSAAYFAARLGEKHEKAFLKTSAILILIIGMWSLNNSFQILDAPISYSKIKSALTSNNSANNNKSESPDGTIKLVASNSYSPQLQNAAANKPYKLIIESKNLGGCGQYFTIPKLGIQTELPANGTTEIDLPPQPRGKLLLSCSMGMFVAYINFT